MSRPSVDSGAEERADPVRDARGEQPKPSLAEPGAQRAAMREAADGEPDPDAFVLPEEKALFVELATAAELVRAEIERERFVEAMGVMSRLRKPVDAFFEKVTQRIRSADTPRSTKRATRLTSAEVLPDPAAASTQSGPCSWRMNWSCSSFLPRS